MPRTSKIQQNPKLKALSLIVFVLIIATLGYAILFQSRAAVPASPTVYLLPETKTIAPNTNFTVTVRENSGLTSVNAVTAAFTYPVNLVDFVSIDYTGSPFNAEAGSSTANGTIMIDRYINPSGSTVTPVANDQLIATVTFKTKTASGSAAFGFTNATQLWTHPAPNQSSTNLITSTSRTQGSSLTVDALAPTVTLSGISNNQQIASTSTVPVLITANDDTGVLSLDILIDGKSVAKPNYSGSAYTYQWQVSGLALGAHTIQVLAKDGYGNTGQSAITTISVVDKTPPSVSLTAPSSPAKGTVTLTATATDTGGGSVAKVEFYAGSTKIGEDTSSPYSITWNTASGSFPDGPYALTAKAFDNASPANTTTSSAVSVTVENQDKTPPSKPGAITATSVSPSVINLSWGVSTDNVGVAGYQISRNGTLIKTVTTTSYSDTGLAANTSYNYSIVAVDTSNNQSAATTIAASTRAAKIGDFNEDDAVNMTDLGLMLINWRTDKQPYDINKDGIVSGGDLATLLGNYGR